MYKLALIFILFCFSGATTKTKFCSPAVQPFQELLNDYKPETYIVVEGHFVADDKKKHYTSKFMVNKSSDDTISVGKEYNVFEYGPFGSLCEMYEMEAAVGSKLIGKNKPRLLILYKNLTKNNKLVAPIFWEAGADASKNRIVTNLYNHQTREDVWCQCATNLDNIWAQISEAKPLQLEWKEQSDSAKIK